MSAKPSSLLQRNISLIELSMSIVIIGVAETGMRIIPLPTIFSGMRQ